MGLQDLWQTRGQATGGQRPNTRFSWSNPTRPPPKMPPKTSTGWDWNGSNPLGNNFNPYANAPGGKAPATTMVRAAGPAMGESFEPYVDPTKYVASGNLAPETPMVQETPYVDPTKYVATGNVAPPIPVDDAPVAPFQPVPYEPPKQPTDIPYATFENLLGYFNPYYQFLMDEGSRQIQNSAAARGRLGSSSTINDIGNWAGNAGAQAYEGALNAFMGDRTGMYDIFKDSRDFDWNRYQYENNLSYGMYSAEKGDWDAKLKDFYDMMVGLSNVGANAAGNASDLASGSSTALANLFMAMAQMNAMGGVAQGQQQGNFMSSLFSLLPMLMNTGKAAGG